MTDWALPVAALGIALVTFIATQFRGLQAADRDHVLSVERRLEQCEQARVEFEKRDRQRDSDMFDLKGENLRLYQRVSELEAKMGTQHG